MIDRRDRQANIFQVSDAHRAAIQVQTGPDDDGHHGPLQQRLAIGVNAGRELIVLGLMLEERQRRQIAARQDNRLSTGICRKRNQNETIILGQVLVSREPDRGVLHTFVLLVQDGEDLARRCRLDQMPKLPLANYDAAVHTVADEVHHVDAGLCQRREVEVATDAA